MKMISLKDYFKSTDKTTFLFTEGGLAGHLNHLYDDQDLTFRDLKEILSDASTGKLQVVEKTDGQNIFLSFNVSDQTARAARNKGQISKDGVTAEELNSLFGDRSDNVRNSFVTAVKTFNKIIEQLDTATQTSLFGPDTNIFYNCEIVNSLTSNVIKYNKNYIIIHSSGHTINKPFIKRNRKEFTEEDLENNISRMSKILDEIQRQSPADYQFTVDPAIQLNNINNDSYLNNAILRINKLLNTYNVNDVNTIGEYLASYVRKYLNYNNVNISADLAEQIVNKILSKPDTVPVTTIYKQLKNNYSPELIELVKQILENKKNIFKDAIFPLENIIHDFAVQMLKGVHSVFVLHPSIEVRRLQDEVAQSIIAIQNSGNEAAHEMLRRQLEKLKSVDNITSSIEGVVFQRNGKIYKFTGNFAPVNQLLGLFKYGRL